ncbi:hypothetical protein [Hyphomicrobium sp.]|uniref:hypothetical protein n=1 Tax=Hyphomicrobium sp. TaxID=82 RepID=UPI0025BA262B|nr:hypothetical protein [Hyphomicrobium sp.]MCC7252372.1 hypothetical protein [Hyphomicrobium sp.]
MQTLAELINLRRRHLVRLANQNGAAGEAQVLSERTGYLPRPRGQGAKNLLAALSESGITIKLASFDAVALPAGQTVDFSDMDDIRKNLPNMTFIEIKTANQPRVKPDFSGFFFAFTEGEILASEALGERHKVLLVNKATSAVHLTSVAEIIARSKSLNWQVSVQL